MENNLQNNESGGFNQFAPNNNFNYQTEDYRVGFGRRLGAAVLDFLFLSILGFLGILVAGVDLSAFASISLENMAGFSEQMESLTKVTTPISVIITFIYYSLEIFMAASLGKLILGIKITDSDMQIANYQKLFVRFILKHISTVFTMLTVVTSIGLFSGIGSFAGFVVFVGFLFVLGQKRQAFHDMAAGTAVYYKSDLNAINSGH